MTRFKNHRSEENRFKKWKERDEKFMRVNDLTEDKIKLIYDYDRMIFNSDRRFYEHTLQPSDNFFEFVCDNSTAEITTVENFMNSIHSIALAQALEEFGFEVQLIVFLMYREYTGKEISEITGIPRYTISRKLSKLEKVYKSKNNAKCAIMEYFNWLIG